MTATSIRLKKSSVTGRIPVSSDLAYGELASIMLMEFSITKIHLIVSLVFPEEVLLPIVQRRQEDRSEMELCGGMPKTVD